MHTITTQATLATSSYSTHISCTNLPLPQVLTLPTYFKGPKIMHYIIHTALPDQSIKSILLWQVCLIFLNIYSKQHPNATGRQSCRCIYDKRHVHSKQLEDLVLERGTCLCNATSIKSAQVEARIPAKIKPPTSEASGIPTKFLGSVFGKSLCTKVLRWPPDGFFSTMQMCNARVSTSTEVVKWPCSMFPTFSWGGFETFEWPNLRWLSSIQPLGQCGYYGPATYPTTVGETQDCSQFNQQITRHYKHDKDGSPRQIQGRAQRQIQRQGQRQLEVSRVGITVQPLSHQLWEKLKTTSLPRSQSTTVTNIILRDKNNLSKSPFFFCSTFKKTFAKLDMLKGKDQFLYNQIHETWEGSLDLHYWVLRGHHFDTLATLKVGTTWGCTSAKWHEDIDQYGSRIMVGVHFPVRSNDLVDINHRTHSYILVLTLQSVSIDFEAIFSTSLSGISLW